MPHKDSKTHSEYNREWLNDLAHPERLEHKRARDKARYEAKKSEILEQRKEYYQNNKEKVQAREAKYRAESARIIALARSVPCADCKGDFPSVCMQFHHIDPATKSGDVRAMGHPTRVKREIAKCVVICANCHCIRHGEIND